MNKYFGRRAKQDSLSDRGTSEGGDIRDGTLLDELFPGLDAVVHFAAESHVDRSQLLDAILRNELPRFMHVSTDERGATCWRAATTARTALSITRRSNNYGPYYFPEKVVPLFVMDLIDDKRVPLCGEGLNVPTGHGCTSTTTPAPSASFS
ncbi:hypothetical protein FB451DRAFT_1393415 [Mycena latifolia]|nr:hypothetical protein FB451DRAFT_1393415 [Mycena latifolia]